MERLVILAYLILFAATASHAQLSSKSKKAIELYTEADNYRVRGQYQQAIRLLNEAIGKDDGFVEAYHRLGLVYYNMRTYAKAIEQFEKGLSLTKDLRLQKMFWFDLGETYILVGDYEKAMKVLSAFINNETQNRARLQRATQNFRSAEFALKNKNENAKYRQRALGDTVNRFVMQYFPVLTADQQEMIFTRRTGFTDMNDEDLVVSKRNGRGEWSEPSSISAFINSEMNEGTCTSSADGSKLIFTSCAGRDNYGSCDLYESNKVGTEWSAPKNLGPYVNTPAWESQPSLSADGRTLYFVSDRRSGLGQRDIWVTTLDDKGLWSRAANVGKPVNSEFDEMSPFIHVNNRTLYFATNALQGFGGYDIFFCERDSLAWAMPRNIGSPINNHDDQYSLFITADGKKGYYSHEETKEDGRSYSKIYEILIPEENWQKYRSNYVRGVVRDKDSRQVLQAKIELIDLSKASVESRVKSDSLTGKYLIVLTQGAEYGLYITKPGYLFRSMNFNYSEVSDFEPIVVDIELEKVREGSVVVLNNIFFDVDKYELKEKSVTELTEVIRFLNTNPSVRIQVSGHTDDVGKSEYNIDLSHKRSRSVVNYLISKGIDKSRIVAKGYGASRPLGDNNTDEGRQLNRRIEILVIGSKAK
jgi:OmpA-OmpF porin, OOP family